MFLIILLRLICCFDFWLRFLTIISWKKNFIRWFIHLQQNFYNPVQCQNGESGLRAHPFDCTKFLNCDQGRTFIQDCGPGTAFNDAMKSCDYDVNCGIRNFGGNTNADGQLDIDVRNQNSNRNQIQYPRSSAQDGQLPEQDVYTLYSPEWCIFFYQLFKLFFLIFHIFMMHPDKWSDWLFLQN